MQVSDCGFWQVIYDKDTGRSRGFGFVTMSTIEEVEAAAQQFNGYVSMQGAAIFSSAVWLYRGSCCSAIECL